jgi:acetylornithine/N-succinyldiaminopimelate aminotransferase
MGRTGEIFAYQHERILPDAISLAKALGNGLPIGAMLCKEELGKSLRSGTHGSTFGGNLLAATAANVAFSIIRQPQTLAMVRAKGEHLFQAANRLQSRYPERVSAVRGRGLLMGVEVVDPSGVVNRCREGGILVNLAGDKTVRFAPPFTVTTQELDEGMRVFEQALSA